MNRLRGLLLISAIFSSSVIASRCFAEEFPSTARLEWPEEDLSGRMMDGAHRFIEAQIAAAPEKRAAFWKHDTTSIAAWNAAHEANRQRLATILGVVDPRLPPRMERYGDDRWPALVAETSRYRIYQIRWSVLEGIDGEGLLVEPKAQSVGQLVVIPDVTQTPEQVLGLAPGVPEDQQFARRLAERGLTLVIPTLISREPLRTDDPQLQKSEQTGREWLYRQAYHMGRQVIGFEIQKILGAVDWFQSQQGKAARIGVVGYGEGGLLALYSAAIDQRINLAVVSGYFEVRQRVWSEPIDRNVWSLLKYFGDAEVASLILPRHLIIEHSSIPSFESKKGNRQTLLAESVLREFHRIPNANQLGTPPTLIPDNATETTGPFSKKTLEAITIRWKLPAGAPAKAELPQELRNGFEPQERQARALKQIETYVQLMVRRSDQLRDKRFLFQTLPELERLQWSTNKEHPTQQVERFTTASQKFREEFRREGMGQFEVPYLPLNPRSRKILETDKWTAWDVVIDVWPDVFAWGVLILPKDLKPGEKRPVVVCQHGRQGVPLDTINRNLPAYNDFAARLAERGFITFAPHNLYRGEDRYRWLCRKANNVEGTLFSFIIGQHEQILTWLGTLPMVDSKRIAFYGLSYGGETAVRVPTVLEGYCLSICSGDFNQWTRKVAGTDHPGTFMRTMEWEMPYWNLGQTYDYAEMSYLMLPRPFMVERGHLDLVGRDHWVAHEYAKVRFLYDQLGLGNKTDIEFFQGGHSINGQGTFRFLHKHLNWPEERDQ